MDPTENATYFCFNVIKKKRTWLVIVRYFGQMIVYINVHTYAHTFLPFVKIKWSKKALKRF